MHEGMSWCQWILRRSLADQPSSHKEFSAHRFVAFLTKFDALSVSLTDWLTHSLTQQPFISLHLCFTCPILIATYVSSPSSSPLANCLNNFSLFFGLVVSLLLLFYHLTVLQFSYQNCFAFILFLFLTSPGQSSWVSKCDCVTAKMSTKLESLNDNIVWDERRNLWMCTSEMPLCVSVFSGGRPSVKSPVQAETL